MLFGKSNKYMLSKDFFTRIVIGLLILSFCPSLKAEPAVTFSLLIEGKRIWVEVANTPKTRQKGLMFRKKLEKDHGMIFVYPKPQKVSMWMKNTLIPLSVAFINEKGLIYNIRIMEPQTTTIHGSDGLAKYALEMSEDWFATNKVQVGSKINGLSEIPKAR